MLGGHGTFRWKWLGASVAALCLIAVAAAAQARDVRLEAVAAYTGPTTLAPGRHLTADVRLAPSRIVAVTFVVNGRPIASDTVAPYTAVVLPRDLPARDAGRIRIRVVTRNAQVLSSAAVAVTFRAKPKRSFVEASPRSNLRAIVARLEAGRVTVRLAPGDYHLGAIRLGSGARLIGSGPKTRLFAERGRDSVITVQGSDVTVADLGIDGSAGDGGGHLVVVRSPSTHVVLRRLELANVHGVAVHAWGRYGDVSVQDSRVDGGGVGETGVLALVLEANDVSVIRSRITGFRSYGINFQHVPHYNRASGLRNVALGNVVTDIRDSVDTDGRSQGGIWSGGAAAAIIGNTVARAYWDGIETVGSSEGVVIAKNRISDTRTGIYLEHSTNGSTVADNVISGVRTGINVEWRYGGVASERNIFVRNTIVQATRNGLFLDLGANANLVKGNVVQGAGLAAIVLQGSSNNRILDNLACEVPSPLVVERIARAEDGSIVSAESNEVQRNTIADSCRA